VIISVEETIRKAVIYSQNFHKRVTFQILLEQMTEIDTDLRNHISVEIDSKWF
jgi:hypothetical protein